LRHRDQSGAGQHIDLALLDTQVAWLANQAMNYLVGGTVSPRMGSAHPNIAPYQVVGSSDGHFMLAVGNDAQFRRCCDLLSLPQLARDQRYATNAARVQNRTALLSELAPAFKQRRTRDWIALLEGAGVPCAPVSALDQVFADPQIQARGLRMSLPHALGGTVPSVANPVRFSATPNEYRRAPPQLGEHTDEVLRELLGADDAAIAALRASATIA
jgi:crotonobetainyl-CoA:carnitine CoA-transferase CaiB-like acyl-CoA transferase